MKRWSAGHRGAPACVLVLKVRSLNCFRTGKASAPNVASRLGMSHRTLARALSAEGVTFSVVLEMLRQALAKRYFRGNGRRRSRKSPGWPGYREISSFTHAFVRWTGLTPKALPQLDERAAGPGHASVGLAPQERRDVDDLPRRNCGPRESGRCDRGLAAAQRAHGPKPALRARVRARATGRSTGWSSAAAVRTRSGRRCGGCRRAASQEFVRVSTGCVCGVASRLSMPVATTETRTIPSRLSSKVAPTMTLASWSTCSRMRVAASSTSNSMRSLPPVMEMMRPLARLIEGSSISGLEIAATAALSTRFSPEASPGPSWPCLSRA